MLLFTKQDLKKFILNIVICLNIATQKMVNDNKIEKKIIHVTFNFFRSPFFNKLYYLSGFSHERDKSLFLFKKEITFCLYFT